MIRMVREYSSVDAYRADQARKTADPATRARFDARREHRIRSFRVRWTVLTEHAPPGSRILCLGARYGEEVEAFRQLGFDATGVDLVPCPPLVIEADFHNLPFADGSFDAVFTNSLDHALVLSCVLAEIRRVLRRPGWLLMRLFFRDEDFGDYETCRFDEDDALALLPDFAVAWRLEKLGRVRLLLHHGPEEAA